MTGFKKYFIPFLWGIVGMLFAQLFILFSAGLGINFPIYVIIYPVVFFLFSFFLNNTNPRNWVLNSLLICLFPVLYWVWILWSENQLQLNKISLYSDNGIIIVLLITIIFSLSAGMLIIRSQRKKIYRIRSS